MQAAVAAVLPRTRSILSEGDDGTPQDIFTQPASHGDLRDGLCGHVRLCRGGQAAALGGDAVNNLIIDALAAQNLTGNPAISANGYSRIVPKN